MNSSNPKSGVAPSPDDAESYPQAGRERRIIPAPVGHIGTGAVDNELEILRSLDAGTVMMMGDNPALPRMPRAPALLDFFKLRFGDLTFRHLLTSARRAYDDGMDEKIVLACLLHDISNGCLIRADHGYWGAQIIAPYVSEEIAWAVQYHQALRYYADESVGYAYPESYDRFFGPDFVPPEYIRRDAQFARSHRWYMTSRLITIYDIYHFDAAIETDIDFLEDIIGRHFKQPEEGLGFDGSPVAHMWRTMIWPNNFL